MNLQREVSAAHGVQKIEPDRKLRAEPSVHGIAQQLSRMREHQIHGRNLHPPRSETKQQAVFLWNAIKAPCMIGLVLRQIANLFHPVSAPDARVEIRDHAKR